MSTIPVLPPRIRDYIGDFVARARRRALVRAGGLAYLFLLAWALLWCVVDRFLQLGGNYRLLLLVSGLAAAVAIVFRPLAAVLWRRDLDWAAAAAEIERTNPRFGERIVTVTSRLLGPPEHRGSADMLYRLLGDVDRATAAGNPPRVIVPIGAAVLPWVLFAILLAGAFYLMRVESFGLPRLLFRFVAPLADVPPVTTAQLSVSPGEADLLQSEPLRVELTARRLDGLTPWVWLREEGGEWTKRAMSRLRADRFAFTLSTVDRDLRYYVEGGDARTREFRVRVLRKPAVSEFHIRYVYPAYAARPPLVVTNSDGLIEAPRDTEATVTVTATEPLQSALLSIGRQKILMGRTERDNVRRATFKITETGPYELDLISTRDVAGTGPAGMYVRALADQKPLVRLVQAGEGLRLNPRDIVPLAYQALDDYGIESLAVRAQVNGSATAEFPVERSPDPRRNEGTFNLDLAAIKLGVGDVVSVTLAAKDRAGQQSASESLQVLVAPRSVDVETHRRVNELDAAAQLAGLVNEELEATAKAFAEAAAKKGRDVEAAAAASARGNRYLTTANETAVLMRQALLRGIVNSRQPELGTVLANLVDASQLLTAGAEAVIRGHGPAGSGGGDVGGEVQKLQERCRVVQRQIRVIADGERAAAVLADRENLAAAENRAGEGDQRSAERIRKSLERAREEVAVSVKALNLDPGAGDLDAQLKAKAEAAMALVQGQSPVDFAAAARDWSQEVQKDPLRRLGLDERLAAAAQAEAVRPGADLVRAHDLQTCSRAAARLVSDAASDKYAGRPVQAGAPNQFAAAVAALQREHAFNRKIKDLQPAEEAKLVRQAAAEARTLVGQWAGEAPFAGGRTGVWSFTHASSRGRRWEDLALRGSATLASRDYAAAREADRQLVQGLAKSPASATGPATAPPSSSATGNGEVSPSLQRDARRVEQLTERAEKMDDIQSDQEKLAAQTASPNRAQVPPPVLADEQVRVAERIAEVGTTETAQPPAPVGPSPAPTAGDAEDPSWRGRATASILRAQEQLAAMPQHLTRTLEAAAAVRQAENRVAMIRGEAASSPPERRAALERAAAEAEQERKAGEDRLRTAALPVIPATAEALAAKLAPFEPESTAAREVIGKELALALRELESAGRGGDPVVAERAAGAARQAIDAAQRELARAQELFTERDPLVAAKWFARAAAESLSQSPPDVNAAHRRQLDTSMALSRAWDRTVHQAAAQRLAMLPSMQPVYALPLPPPVLAAKGRGAAGAKGGETSPASNLASVREWGRLRPREMEELNAPVRESEPAGYEKALQLYFESLNRAHEGEK